MSSDRRFDDSQYLVTWQATGRYPAIHDEIYSLIATHAQNPETYVDLCCSTGLLGQQLLTRLPSANVVGVDGDLKALKRGYEAGIKYPRIQLWLKNGNFEPLELFLRQHQVTTLVARRCLPELFGIFAEDMAHGPKFVAMLRTSGVKRVFLQGRVPARHAKNVLRSVQDEVAFLHTGYELKELTGQCAYLEARADAEL